MQTTDLENRNFPVDESKLSGIKASGLEVKVEDLDAFIGVVIDLKDENKKEFNGVVASGFFDTFYSWQGKETADAYKKLVKQIESGNYRVERISDKEALMLFDEMRDNDASYRCDKPYKVKMLLR